MSSLTNKVMSAALGLVLALGASIAMTAASSVLAPSDAEARTLSRSKIVGRGGQKTERSKIDFGKLKELKPAKRELARERIIEVGGAKGDLVKRIREKQARGRI